MFTSPKKKVKLFDFPDNSQLVVELKNYNKNSALEFSDGLNHLFIQFETLNQAKETFTKFKIEEAVKMKFFLSNPL